MKIFDFMLCQYGEFTQKHPIGPVNWPFFDLLVIHSGQVRIQILKGKCIELNENEGLLIFPDTTFSGYSISPTSRASVHHFSFVDLNAARLQLHLRDFCDSVRGCLPLFRFSDNVIKDLDRSLRLAQEGGEDVLDVKRQSLFNLILAELQYPSRVVKVQKGFDNICQWLQKNVHRNLTVEDMALEAKLSSSHFRKKFRDLYYVSATQFFFNLKMTEAKRLLCETQKPIKEIAEILSYDDTAHFYRAFHKCGVGTPKQFRLNNSFMG